MQKRILRAEQTGMRLIFLAVVPFLTAVPSVAAVLSVGPGQTYAKPCQAFAAARDGDVIEIDASGNYDGDVCVIYRNNLTIRGVNGRARIDAAGKYAQGKGIWVVAGDNTVVENIEFSGARVPDRNGAGIRLDSGNLTVRNCVFHHNETGILGGFYGKVLIEHSEFYDNGYGDGQSHNIYLNAGVAEFTLRYSASRRAIVGHLVKSRAAKNFILYNRLTQETGTGSYEIDLSNGGQAYVIGNIVQQGDTTQNRGMLTFGLEGLRTNAPNELYVINNTFVSTRAAGATFLQISSSFTTPAVVRNNVFSGSGIITTQSNALMAGNVTTGNMGFLDPSQYDYRISNLSAALNAGVDPGEAAGFSLKPVMQYVHPLCAAERYNVGPIDAGAYEHGVIEASPVCAAPPPPHDLAGLSPSAVEVESGSALSLTVSLTSPAPAGGTVVALSSSVPAILPVPATVTVPAGQTGISVSVTAGEVLASTAVRLTASLGSATVESSVTVVPRPPQLAAFIPSSSTVESGSALSLTVSLTSPAPAGGTVVALSSSAPAVLPVPATATVPAGQTGISVSVTAGSVTVSTPVTLSANLGAATITATVTVSPRPPQLAAFTPSPATVESGSALSLTVSLTSPAPAGGTVVALSSSAPAILPVPATVTVPAGQTGISVSVTAGSVTVSTPVTLSANLGAATITATVTVNPRPVLATLTKITRSSAQVRPGEQFTITVQLAARAPAAGVLVRFSSSRPGDVELPASTVIPAGASSASVTGTVRNQAASGPVTIQAASSNTLSTSLNIRATR